MDGHHTHMQHLDAIKYMGEVIAEKLGLIYGLRIYYWQEGGRTAWLNTEDLLSGISIAGPDHDPNRRRLYPLDYDGRPVGSRDPPHIHQ